MADNILVTQGSGTTIATENISSVQYQKVKLIDGTGASTTPITATAGAMDVNIKSGNPTTITATQATGTNLHTVVDSGAVTVTNATAANLKCEATLAASQILATLTTITNAVHVDDNSGSLTVDNSGTFAVQATAVGTVADDATTPGAPVMIGGKAVETDGTTPGSVSAEDDVAICRTTRDRRLLVSTDHPYMWSVSPTAYSSAQTDTEIVAAPGANLSLYITDIIISNGATAGTVTFEEDTASAKTKKFATLYLAANGGAVVNLKTPIRCTANKNFGITSVTVTTHSVTINGYIAP